MKRRNFIELSIAGSIGSFLPGCVNGTSVPGYLRALSSDYIKDPRKTALKWFQDARFGLFMHYGLYSLVGRHEWVQLRELIPVAEYAKLKDRFTARNFNADFITDLALEAGMKYINITSRHHDSFCLWDTKYSDFKSTNTPAKRDLIGELSEQCNKKGLAFFLYYSHGRDWKHPHAPNNDKWGGSARPEYDPPEPSYMYGEEHDLGIYLEFMQNQIRELLTNYKPVAGIWLDGIGVPLTGDYSVFECQKLYDMIHSMQPQVLVSYKQGLIGTEDFRAPERQWKGKAEKPLEICDTLQPKGWGYMIEDDGKHKTADQVLEMLKRAAEIPANLLLNTGPLPEGDIHPEDITTLKEVGKRIEENGWDAVLA